MFFLYCTQTYYVNFHVNFDIRFSPVFRPWQVPPRAARTPRYATGKEWETVKKAKDTVWKEGGGRATKEENGWKEVDG